MTLPFLSQRHQTGPPFSPARSRSSAWHRSAEGLLLGDSETLCWCYVFNWLVLVDFSWGFKVIQDSFQLFFRPWKWRPCWTVEPLYKKKCDIQYILKKQTCLKNSSKNILIGWQCRLESTWFNHVQSGHQLASLRCWFDRGKGPYPRSSQEGDMAGSWQLHPEEAVDVGSP